MSRLQQLNDARKRLQSGFVDKFGESRMDNHLAFQRGKDDEGIDPDAAKIDQTFGTNRTVTAGRELLGMANPHHVRSRDAMGLGLSDDKATKAGQLLGIAASDLVQDRSREAWWLLNAAQAVGNVAQEKALNLFAPHLYDRHEVMRPDGRSYDLSSADDRELAMKQGHLGYDTRPTKGKTVKDGRIHQRNYEPGFTDALMVPTGLAINSGIGLMNPFGGQQGYEAAVPSEEDPNKTANPILEVASKYILGRTGNLLNWNEFSEARPDVSKDEYRAYKAFKFDNDMDYDLSDGDAVLMPGGALKYTNEGIHGPEVQFLGRSLPLSTAIMPAAMSIVGTTLGARYGRRPVRDAFLGGMASSLGGMAVGNAIEQERRTRNMESNMPVTPALDPEGY